MTSNKKKEKNRYFVVLKVVKFTFYIVKVSFTFQQLQHLFWLLFCITFSIVFQQVKRQLFLQKGCCFQNKQKRSTQFVESIIDLAHGSIFQRFVMQTFFPTQSRFHICNPLWVHFQGLSLHFNYISMRQKARAKVLLLISIFTH